MRTTITLNQAILGSLLKATGLTSKSRAVLLAVEDYLRRQRLKKVLSRCGRYHFHPQTAQWRHLEHGSD